MKLYDVYFSLWPNEEKERERNKSWWNTFENDWNSWYFKLRLHGFWIYFVHRIGGCRRISIFRIHLFQKEKNEKKKIRWEVTVVQLNGELLKEKSIQFNVFKFWFFPSISMKRCFFFHFCWTHKVNSKPSINNALLQVTYT